MQLEAPGAPGPGPEPGVQAAPAPGPGLRIRLLSPKPFLACVKEQLDLNPQLRAKFKVRGEAQNTVRQFIEEGQSVGQSFKFTICLLPRSPAN